MGVFQKQGVWWIDYYVSGHRKRERIGPNKRLARRAAGKATGRGLATCFGNEEGRG